MPLAALVPTFELETADKPWFPHMANNEANYGKDIFPTPADYLADGMLPKKRAKFMEWYEENKHIPFRLEESVRFSFFYRIVTAFVLASQLLHQ